MSRSLFSCCAAALLLASAAVSGAETRMDRDQIAPDTPPEVREQLLRLYGERESQKLTAAVEALGRMGPKANVAAPFLATMIYSKGAPAMQVLHNMGRASLEPLMVTARIADHFYLLPNSLKLLGGLRDEEATEVLAYIYARSGHGCAAEALRAIGPAAMSRLLPVLNGADPDSRALAAKALGLFATPEVVQALCEALKDEDVQVRGAAVAALNSIVTQSSGALRPSPAALRVAVKDPDAEVSKPAVALASNLCTRGLSGYFELLGEALAGADRFALMGAAEILQPLAAKGAPPEMEKLLEEQLLPALAQAMADVDSRVRSRAVRIGARLGRRSLVPALVKALKDDDNLVREEAVAGLRGSKTPEAADAALEMLSDKDAFVRKAAAEALGGMGDKRAVEPLTALLEDTYEDVRAAARRALAQLGVPPPGYDPKTAVPGKRGKGK